MSFIIECSFCRIHRLILLIFLRSVNKFIAVHTKQGSKMSRPRLKEALNIINLYRTQGFKEADEAIAEYDEILKTEGEFLAGRFIIELCIEINQTLTKESQNAKS